MFSTFQWPGAALYPLDATAYTSATRSFVVSSRQELPRLRPGAVVAVEQVGPRERDLVVHAGGVDIRPFDQQGVHALPIRLFAERGDVLVHPAVAWHEPSWRHLEPVNFREPLPDPDTPPADPEHWWRTAERRRDRERELLRSPGVLMQMRIVWVAGTGSGPAALAVLRPCEPGGPAGVEVPLGHLSKETAQWATEQDVTVEVHGDPNTHDVVLRLGSTIVRRSVLE